MLGAAGRFPKSPRRLPAVVRWSAATVAGVAAGVVCRVHRHGVDTLRSDPAAPHPDEADPLLDQFLPAPEVAERHSIHVVAPAATTFAITCDFNLFGMPIAGQALFKGRARGSLSGRRTNRSALPARVGQVGPGGRLGGPRRTSRPRDRARSGHATVGSERQIPCNGTRKHFAAFDEPDYVKIAWTLRVDAVDEAHSIFRTETRVVATDASARRRFRRYWALLSPGIILIRWAALNPIRRDAERCGAIHGPVAHGL